MMQWNTNFQVQNYIIEEKILHTRVEVKKKDILVNKSSKKLNS